MHNSTSSSYSKKKLKDDSSDEYSNYESYELPANFVPRHSERNFNKSISYQELNPELEELLEEEEYSEQYYENDKIDHIYLSRKSNNGLEYLVTFQHQEGIFAQWIVDFMANEVSNFARLLKKFNETESKFKFYDTSTREFSISYDSPIHVISNRKCPYAPNLQEFLLEYTLDQGTVFSWEKETDDIPRNLVEHYLSTKVSIDPIVHTTRPDSLVITPEEAEEYKSRDNCIPRDYQIVGINWLLKCFCSNHGCILADEMGLGKTIECLMFLKYLDLHTSYHGPHIIAVRTNTYRQWRSEIERWTDFKYVPYYGAPEQRSTYRTYSFPSINESGEIEPNKFGFNILLISYDIFLKDYTEFRNIPWQIICVDEGHRIKNDNGKKHKAFTNIPYQHRIILTGTPIQSTLKELWNLLHFVSPNYFLGDSTFPEDDVESLEPDELDELKKLIAPHLMRRSLLEVEKSIIPKDEKIAFLQLTKTQKELTRLTLMHELYRLSNDCNLNESNMLHRICNHPFLVKGAEQYYTGKYKISRLQLLINCSSKLIFLDKILPIFRKEQRSVLIFSQRLKILKILDEYCQLKKYPHEILTGNMNDNEKDVAIKKFLDPTKDVFIFLISTRSGSEGLNLTKASITIIFDPDWNPQNDLQALGRCHRIGQTQKVDVLRLITYGTYEHEMFARAQRKMKLWKTLLGNGVITDPSLAQIVKSEENPKNVQQQNSLLLNPAIQNEMSALDNITLYQINVSDDIQIPKESNIKEPPPIDQYKTKKNHSFEDVLENMATIIDISELEESNSRFIPKVDCSLGLDNEQFLEMFPFDPSTISSVTKKKNKKERVQKVQFDAKVAKRIIQFLELHGYGEWEAIHASIHYICPIEQLQKFCQVATILHFRAIDWTKVVCFPFLLLQLKKDISSFDLSYVMCNDDSDWYSIFSKRSSLNGEGYSCKLISNHIHKTALTFLSNLEHHLIINEWRKDDEHIQFPFENLPPSIEQLQHHTDHELYDMLISNQQINTDVNRIGNIFSVIKGQLLMRTIPVERMIIDFWTKSEILTLLSTND
ncbi:SNF2 family N-terminal domain containing protein [Histomonas meleagridis]|nr:SNF2 family N-terminal domain containing protein [Histomonas meleagridis]